MLLPEPFGTSQQVLLVLEVLQVEWEADPVVFTVHSSLQVSVFLVVACRPLNPGLPGVVRTALPDLDRETQDRYQLVVQARDLLGRRGALSGTTAVTVTLTDVNDNPPRFPRSEFDL